MVLVLLSGSVCACSDPSAEALDAAGWRATLSAIDQPTMAYVWAPWSRPSIELLPSVVELEREYADVPVVYVCLEGDDGGFLGKLEPLGRQLRLAADYAEAVEELQLPEPPAALLYGAGGELLRTMTAEDQANPLTPEDIADALERIANP